MTTLPLRFRILDILIKAGGAPMSTKEIYDRLVEEYSGEGQFSLQKMEEHLMAIKAVSLIEGCEPYFDEHQEARYKYCITHSGRSRERFLPKDRR